MRVRRSPPAYWTRARVLAALRRYHAVRGHSAGVAYYATGDRRFPSRSSVLRHFPSMAEAWEAARLPAPPTPRRWSRLEDWYLYEAAAELPLSEVAADLGRAVTAVRARLEWLGFDWRQRCGWCISSASRALGLSGYRLARLLRSRGVPLRPLGRAVFVAPADLAALPEIDWSRAHPDLVADARRELAVRLIRALAVRLAALPYCSHCPV